MKYLASLSILLLMICAASPAARAEGPLSGQAGGTNLTQPIIETPAQWQLNIHAPQIKTEIAAFVIQRKNSSDKIYIPDMDMLVTKDGKRLIPLLRFLRLIEAGGELRNDMVIFKIEGGKLTPLIDIQHKTLEVDGKKIPLNIEVGVSDMTNAGEIYVSEEILKEAFGFDFAWDPERVEYKITTDKELEMFKRRRLKVAPVSMAGIKKMSESLPETEPPARPKTRKPLLSFVQAESSLNAEQQSSQNLITNQLGGLPSLNAWGSIFNGAYKVTLRRNLLYPSPYASGISNLFNWIDRGLWTYKNDAFTVNIGDNTIGLSDLIGPAANLVGITFKWLPGSKGKKRFKDQFFKNAKPTFFSDETFEGYAPMGSTVELYINNRLVESKAVEEFNGAPIGEGYYSFAGMGLMTNSVNEVRIVTKRPDGIIEESRRNVLPVSQLLPAGQFACLGGIGMGRQHVDDNTILKGAFLGTQLFYGITKDLTLGVTAAAQDKFSYLEDPVTGEYYEAPRRYYFGQEARYRVFDRLFAKYNVAVCQDPYSGTQAFAGTTNLDYYMKQLKIGAQLFFYDPEYSNGITSVSDRGGCDFTASWYIFKNVLLQGTLLHIVDNIKGTLLSPKSEDLLTASAELSNIIPRSTLKLQAGYIDRSGDVWNTVKGNIYGAELNSSITDKLDVSLYYSFGVKTNGFSMTDLSYGLPMPDLNSFYPYDKKVKVNFRLTPSLSVSSSYYQLNTQDRVELSSSYNSQGKCRWRSRLDIGGDLNTSKFYCRENVEFELDKNGNNRIGIKAGLTDSGAGYDIGFYVRTNNMFAFKDGHMDNVSNLRIVPERGGIEGTVYLDLNCNGHRDPGEPGVADIAVMVDDAQRAVTNRNGNFYIPMREGKELVAVSLDINSLPAIYTPSQGLQKAHLEEASFTSVNLGVCVLGAVSGTVKLMDNGTFAQNLSGVRVTLAQEGKESELKDSITAYDGSFYIGQIKPGDYLLKIDMSAVPDTYELKDARPQKIRVIAGGKPIEIENCDIYFNLNHERIEELKRKAEEESKKKEAEIEKIKAQAMQSKLTGESMPAGQKMIMDNIHGALQYIYSILVLPKNSMVKEDLVNITL